MNKKEIEMLGTSKNDNGSNIKPLYEKYKAQKDDLERLVLSYSSYNMSQYINSVSHWMEDQDKKKENQSSFPLYSKGDILYIDFGALNFGYEVCYPHPSIVLDTNKYFVLVLPCTTKKYGRSYDDIIDGCYYDGLLQNTAVVIDGLRWVSKTRVIAKLGKIQPTLLYKLEEKVLESLPNFKSILDYRLKRINDLEKQVNDLQRRLKNKEYKNLR